MAESLNRIDIQQLIKEVKARPLLYDRHVGSEAKLEMWKEVTKAIVSEQIYSQMTSQLRDAAHKETQSRWQSLLTSFSRDLRLFKRNKLPQLPSYFDAMKFLIPYQESGDEGSDDEEETDIQPDTKTVAQKTKVIPWRIKNEKLIHAIKHRPYLYNSQSPGDMKQRHELWSEILEEVFPETHSMNKTQRADIVRSLQKRWASLRNCFRRELKLKEAGKLNKRPWCYYNRMLFLAPYTFMGKDVTESIKAQEEDSIVSNDDDESNDRDAEEHDEQDGSENIVDSYDYSEGTEPKQSRSDDLLVETTKVVPLRLNTELLIQTVKQRPALYDPEAYVDSEHRARVWDEVAEVMVPGYSQMTKSDKGLSLQEVQKRWNNLRTCLGRDVRLKKSGGHLKRTWIHFKAMKFLIPHLIAQRTQNLTPQKKSETLQSTNSRRESDLYKFIFESDVENSNSSEESDPDKEKNVNSEDREEIYLEENGDGDERMDCEEKDQRDVKIEPIFSDDGANANAHVSFQNVDADLNFALSLIPMLKQVPSGDKIDCHIALLQQLKKFVNVEGRKRKRSDSEG